MKFYTTARISENMHKTPEGYLVCVGVSIARTGEMIYGAGEVPIDPDDDGLIKIIRSEDEVFRPETIASFEGKGITIAHPEDFLNPENWAQLEKGICTNVRRGTEDKKNDLISDLLIKDAEAIDLIENGLREVSCGYDAKYVQTAKGRGIQKHIVGNHLALVEQGRAGASYAINDHIGKGSTMKFSDRIKKILSKAETDIAAAVTEDSTASNVTAPILPATATNDAVMKAVTDLTAKVEALSKKTKDDFTAPATSAAPAAPVEAAPEISVEDRLAKLETAIQMILEKIDASDDSEEGSDEEDAGDFETDDEEGDEEDSDEVTDGDDDMEPNTLTGDAAARIEILAPGMNPETKDAKAKALKKAYSTKDGKDIIERFTGGKTPDFKNQRFVDNVFIGASEVLKLKRTEEFSKARTRTQDFQSSYETPKGALSPEEMNKKNEEFYKNK